MPCFTTSSSPAAIRAIAIDIGELANAPKSTSGIRIAHGATYMPASAMNCLRVSQRCSAGIAARLRSTLHLDGFPGSFDSSSAWNRCATIGCDDAFSSTRAHGFTVSHRNAAIARCGSTPAASAVSMATASRGSKMPIALIDCSRSDFVSTRWRLRRLPLATNAIASFLRTASTLPIPYAILTRAEHNASPSPVAWHDQWSAAYSRARLSASSVKREMIHPM